MSRAGSAETRAPRQRLLRRLVRTVPLRGHATSGWRIRRRAQSRWARAVVVRRVRRKPLAEDASATAGGGSATGGSPIQRTVAAPRRATTGW